MSSSIDEDDLDIDVDSDSLDEQALGMAIQGDNLNNMITDLYKSSSNQDSQKKSNLKSNDKTAVKRVHFNDFKQEKLIDNSNKLDQDLKKRKPNEVTLEPSPKKQALKNVPIYKPDRLNFLLLI